MKKMRNIVMLLMAVMVLATLTPNTAEAAPKKSITVSAKGAKISKNKFSLVVKKGSQLTVKYGKKNVTKKAKYASSNKKVAIISKKGKITAKKKGTSTITVKYKGMTKKLKLTVMDKKAVSKGSLDVNLVNYTIKNNKFELTADTHTRLVVKQGGKNVSQKASFKSSNPAVAPVVNKKGDTKGLVEAKKPGSCTITVTYGNKTKKLNLKVTMPEAEIIVGNPSEHHEEVRLNVNGGVALRIALRPTHTNGPENKNSGILWSTAATFVSSDPSILYTDRTGNVKAKKPGRCTITATKASLGIKLTIPAIVTDSKAGAESDAPATAEPKEHKHDWVPHTKEVTSYVEDGVETIQDYADEEVEVYVCGCGERVEGDASAHIKAHGDAGEAFEGRTETEVRQVPAGTHTVSKGHYETFKTTDYWTCSGCGETIR